MSRIFISGSTGDFGLVAARLLLDTDPLHGSPHWLAQLPTQLTREHRATRRPDIAFAMVYCAGGPHRRQLGYRPSAVVWLD
jgi:hypothetical protein